MSRETRLPDSCLVELAHEEREALKRSPAAAGSRERLILSGLLYAKKFAIRYAGRVERNPSAEAVDAYISAAYLGLIDGVDSWEPDRGKFYTFITWRIRYKLYEELLARRRMGGFSLDHPDAFFEPACSEDLDARLDSEANCSILRRGMRGMRGKHLKRWREVLVEHYGLDGQGGATLSAIAARRGVSTQAVSKQHARSLAYLREYLESKGVTYAAL